MPGPTVSPAESDGGSISSGNTRPGIVAGPADTDAFALVGQAGNTVVINLSEQTGSSPSFWPELRLYDPLGTLEASDWNFDNAEIVDHHLLQTGIYTVVAKDYSGLYDGAYTLSLTKIPPSVVLTCSASATPTGTAVNFTASVSGGSGPYTWQWWFGDSEVASLQNPSHVYPESTTYAWFLIVRDAGGNGCVQHGLVNAFGAAIFADGFETGTTSAWSGAMP
jgi:PKD repeat protein